MDIARRSSYRSRVPEARLAFGFNQKPINMPMSNTDISPDIPEEKLFNVNPGIIEYKKRPFGVESCESCEDDDDDSESNRWEHSRPPIEKPCGYSYGDLGYCDSDPAEINFVNVPFTTTAAPSPSLNDNCFGRIVDADEPDSKPHYFPAELADAFSEQSETMTR